MLVIRRPQMFSSADESLKDETHLLLFWFGSLVTLHTFVLVHITSVVKPVHIFIPRSSLWKLFKGWALFRVCIWKHALLRMHFFQFWKYAIVCIFEIWQNIMPLTHFQLMLHIYTPWKHPKTYGFLVFSGGIEEEYWLKMC